MSMTLVEPVVEEKRDVQADLVFWKHLDSPSVTVDFTTPEGKEKFTSLGKLEETHSVLIHDIRGKQSEYTLDRNGFTYAHHHVKELKDVTDERHVEDVLIPATEELVKKLIGATEVKTFTHRIRCFAKDANQLADNRSPATSVHADFTPAGVLGHLPQVIKDKAELERLQSSKRTLIINVWRPLKQIRKDPLAICDWTSTNPESDIVANRLVFPHGWNELAKGKFNPAQKWCYLGGQTPDEPLVFKQYDSLAKDGMNVLHTAFADPQFENSDVRLSIEIKMFAFFLD
ncbi:hypothetical protein B0O99DRAFT_184364 [Bisporella sp. PMI_857]|nr:hypothetical protein B0O99DRAFT_184364 [Bisporella sp. PMI_857]